MSRRKEPTIPNELLDQLLAGGTAHPATGSGSALTVTAAKPSDAGPARSRRHR
jgi:hypothetical protein